MIKQYEGANVFNIHFTSGKSVQLTEEEIKELQEESQEELLEKIAELEETINKVKWAISPKTLHLI